MLQQWAGLPALLPRELGDARTVDMPLMDPYDCLALAFGYLLIVAFGRKIMGDRPAFELFGLRVIHNAGMVVLSAYMTVQLTYQTMAARSGNYQCWCLPTSYNDAGDIVARTLWVFYISKPIEFMDTFIMILRKKFGQVSFLHVYHHFSIFLVWYVNVYLNPGGDAWFSAAFNSFIHVLMYGYYLLRSFDMPCPWKRYLTQLQILQFVSFVGQGIVGLVYACNKLWLLAFNMVYAFTLLALFYNFYRKSYKKGGKGVKDEDKEN